MVCLFQTSIVFSLSVVADPTKPTQNHHSQDRMPVDCGLILRFPTRYVSSLTDSHTDTVYRRSTCIEYLWIYSAQMCGHMVPCGMNTHRTYAQTACIGTIGHLTRIQSVYIILMGACVCE